VFDEKRYVLFQQKLGDYTVRIEEATGQLNEVVLYTPKERLVFALCKHFDNAEKTANRIITGLNRGRTFNPW